MPLHREEFLAKVRKGESVLYKGRVINKVEDVPSAVELAGNDPVKKQHALLEVQKRQEEAAREREEIEASMREDEKRGPATPAAPAPNGEGEGTGEGEGEPNAPKTTKLKTGSAPA